MASVSRLVRQVVRNPATKKWQFHDGCVLVHDEVFIQGFPNYARAMEECLNRQTIASYTFVYCGFDDEKHTDDSVKYVLWFTKWSAAENNFAETMKVIAHRFGTESDKQVLSSWYYAVPVRASDHMDVRALRRRK
jgi:hypothetical protein